MTEINPSEKKIGILGGSFDPVHIGHLIIAQDAAEHLGLSEVIFVPAAIPPHKQHVRQAAHEDRLNMLRLAVNEDPRFSVSDLEVQRGGISYTVDTVRDLKKIYPNDELILIVGSDTLLDLHNWYRPEELLSLCAIAAVLRPGEHEAEEIAEKIQLPAIYKKRVLKKLIKAHQVQVSSTEIRTRMGKGLGIRYFVPSNVEIYIYDKGLYSGCEE
jgi:nicotinate-nucleotide adenylyltransferase